MSLVNLIGFDWLRLFQANQSPVSAAVWCKFCQFTASGLVVVERNYLMVYHPYERWADREMGAYTEGETFTPTQIIKVDSETSPPPLLTEADLIALMDKHGIGSFYTFLKHFHSFPHFSLSFPHFLLSFPHFFFCIYSPFYSHFLILSLAFPHSPFLTAAIIEFDFVKCWSFDSLIEVLWYH